jgi:hypothetical protein
MTGQSAGTCDSLQITPDGQVNGAGGGARIDGVERLPAIGISDLAVQDTTTVGGGDLQVEGWSVSGRFGAGIVAVTVEPQGQAAILATLENGWFGAWWPGVRKPRPANERLAPHPGPPFVVRGYDVAGVLIKQITHDP